MLKFDATHEYFFHNASMFYCDDHDTLRITNNYEDSILLSGVESKHVNYFIEKYIEYVLKDEALKDVFKKAIKVKQLNENLEDHNHSKDAA